MGRLDEALTSSDHLLKLEKNEQTLNENNMIKDLIRYLDNARNYTKQSDY